MTSALPPCLNMHDAVRAPDPDFRDRPALSVLPLSKTNGQHTDTSPAHPVHAEPAAGAPASRQLTMDMAEWDMLFDAVRDRLIRTVGERLGQLPDVPQHSAELSASLVQAVVLDCVGALDQLHATLKQERSRRLTP